VAGGQVPGALARACEVDVQPAARGADACGGPVQQAGGAEPGQGGEAVSGGAVPVDIQDIGSRRPGGDGQVPPGMTAEPVADPRRVSSGT
jgi:hypothetical protein